MPNPTKSLKEKVGQQITQFQPLTPSAAKAAIGTQQPSNQLYIDQRDEGCAEDLLNKVRWLQQRNDALLTLFNESEISKAKLKALEKKYKYAEYRDKLNMSNYLNHYFALCPRYICSICRYNSPDTIQCSGCSIRAEAHPAEWGFVPH